MRSLVCLFFFLATSQAKILNDFLQLPSALDWRVSAENCFQTPLEKSESSYAFSVAEALRLRICIKSFGQINTVLSAAQLVKCDPNNHNVKDPLKSWKYISKNGIYTKECFDGSTEVDKCSKDLGCKKVYASQLQTFNTTGPIMQETLFNGPLVATMDMYEDFKYYESGIYVHKTGEFVERHSVVIVGYQDSDENGYWIAMNNFGSSWGEKGFFRVPFKHIEIDSNGTSAEANIK